MEQNKQIKINLNRIKKNKYNLTDIQRDIINKYTNYICVDKLNKLVININGSDIEIYTSTISIDEFYDTICNSIESKEYFKRHDITKIYTDENNEVITKIYYEYVIDDLIDIITVKIKSTRNLGVMNIYSLIVNMLYENLLNKLNRSEVYTIESSLNKSQIKFLLKEFGEYYMDNLTDSFGRIYMDYNKNLLDISTTCHPIKNKVSNEFKYSSKHNSYVAKLVNESRNEYYIIDFKLENIDKNNEKVVWFIETLVRQIYKFIKEQQ